MYWTNNIIEQQVPVALSILDKIFTLLEIKDVKVFLDPELHGSALVNEINSINKFKQILASNQLNNSDKVFTILPMQCDGVQHAVAVLIFAYSYSKTSS